MWTISEMKEKGKAAFKANYWPSVVCIFILMILTAATSASTSRSAGSGSANDSSQQVSDAFSGMSPEQAAGTAMVILGAASVIICISILLKIFLFNPLKVGCYRFYRDNAYTGGLAPLGTIKEGFQDYVHIFLTMFLTELFLILWTCLLIVPGLIKMYSYRMVPYILRDNPELSPTDVITRSREMMDGHKWNTFVYDLSFIGWFLLGAITCELAWLFWGGPYKANSDAALYLRLSGQQ